MNAYGGKCLDARNHGTTDRTAVQQWTCKGTGNQLWSFGIDNARGEYNIISYPTVEYRSPEVLDVAHSSTGNGAKIELWHEKGTGMRNGGGNQAWSTVGGWPY